MGWFSDNSGALQAISTIVLVVVTGVYVALTRSMAKSAREQLGATLKEFDRQRRERLDDLTPHCTLSISSGGAKQQQGSLTLGAMAEDQYLATGVWAAVRLIVSNEGDTSMDLTFTAPAYFPAGIAAAWSVLQDRVVRGASSDKAFTFAGNGAAFRNAAQAGRSVTLTIEAKSERSGVTDIFKISVPFRDLPAHEGRLTGDNAAFDVAAAIDSRRRIYPHD